MKSDPPGFQPQIDYLSHKQTVAELVGFFPGLQASDLPALMVGVGMHPLYTRVRNSYRLKMHLVCPKEDRLKASPSALIDYYISTM